MGTEPDHLAEVFSGRGIVSALFGALFPQSRPWPSPESCLGSKYPHCFPISFDNLIFLPQRSHADSEACRTLATVVVLPLLSSTLNRRGLQAQMLDLNVIRLSLLVAATGFVLLQLSYRSWMLLLGRPTASRDTPPHG